MTVSRRRASVNLYRRFHQNALPSIRAAEGSLPNNAVYGNPALLPAFRLMFAREAGTIRHACKGRLDRSGVFTLNSLTDAFKKISSYFDLSQQKPWDAAHLAVQSAAAAVVAFTVMQTLGLPEKFIGVLSAILVIQPSVGNTLIEAGDRVLATLVGSAVGILCLFILPYGYGTAIALGVTMLVINAIAGFRPDWRYGVVAGVALALGSEQNAIETAQDRGLAIALGAFVGVGVSLLVWPDTAKKRASRHINTALEAAVEMLDIAIGGNGSGEGGNELRTVQEKFDDAISSARDASKGIRLGDRKSITGRIDQSQRFYQAILSIERVTRARAEADIDRNEELNEAIESIRQEACEAVRYLAEKGRMNEDELNDVVDAVERSKALPRTDDPTASLLDNAFVFSLSEMTLALQNLQKAFDNDYDGSVLDWSANLQSAAGKRIGKILPM